MFITLIVALNTKKYWSKPIRIIYYYCVINLLSALLLRLIYWLVGNFKDFFIPILKRFEITDMSFMAILAHLNNFILLGWYFILVFNSNRVSILVRFLYLFFTITSIINYLFIEGFNVHSIYNSIASAVFCFAFSSLHLWYIFNDTDSKVPLLKNPYYWISLGLLVPNIMNTFMYLVGKKLEETDSSMFLLSNIFSDILQILGYIFVAIGFYYARYTKYLPQKTTTSLPPQ